MMISRCRYQEGVEIVARTRYASPTQARFGTRRATARRGAGEESGGGIRKIRCTSGRGGMHECPAPDGKINRIVLPSCAVSFRLPLSLPPTLSPSLSLSLFLFILLPLVSRLRFVARQVSSESGSRGDSLGEAGWAEWNGKYSYPANLLPSAGDTIAARRDKQGREGEEATEFYTFKHPYV